MNKQGFLYRVFDLYYDGFRHMTLGRTLWAIILVKLFVMFAILKVFFFPNYIKQHARDGVESDFVATEVLRRAPAPAAPVPAGPSSPSANPKTP